MMKNINEYRQSNLLSVEAASFIEHHSGGPIPENIRKELEQYLIDIGPEVAKSKLNLDQLMKRAFNK